jgi:hypothetical protein
MFRRRRTHWESTAKHEDETARAAKERLFEKVKALPDNYLK